MKKNFSIAAVALFASALLFSCKKDYTCTCTITTGGTSTTQTIPLDKSSKKDAEDNCKKAQTTYTTSVSTASCKI